MTRPRRLRLSLMRSVADCNWGGGGGGGGGERAAASVPGAVMAPRAIRHNLKRHFILFFHYFEAILENHVLRHQLSLDSAILVVRVLHPLGQGNVLISQSLIFCSHLVKICHVLVSSIILRLPLRIRVHSSGSALLNERPHLLVAFFQLRLEAL